MTSVIVLALATSWFGHEALVEIRDDLNLELEPAQHQNTMTSRVYHARALRLTARTWRAQLSWLCSTLLLR